ncbi:MAG: hypothetical protein K2H85_05475 [Allobaculum sp.]|nr:hypothetical protein [Allobaculum sp.]
MKKITKEIPEIIGFPIDPDDPVAMDQKYPFMYNIFDPASFLSLPDLEHPDKQMVMLIGHSSHLDDLENAIFYGGTLGRDVLYQNPKLRGNLSKIMMTNFIKHGGVEEADPKDGHLKVLWPQKTLRYQDEEGFLHEEDVDIEMDYIDTEKIKDPKGNLLAQYSWLWHGGDPDELADQSLADHWKILISQYDKEDPSVEDKEMVQKRLSIWEKFRDGKPLISVDFIKNNSK